jgi:solute carrier family 25 iron transporter 28/37
MEPDDEYESLPDHVPASTHMMAGAGAGIAEHCVMYAVDTVKTRMQSVDPKNRVRYKNVPDGLIQIARHEGPGRLFKGMSVMVVGAGPAHAMYFACYEKMKRVISGTENGSKRPLAQASAGVLSTLLHDAVMNPADVVKQRLQMHGSPYNNVLHCIRETHRREGLKAFYRSYGTQLLMNVPFQATHFVLYEAMTEITNKDRQYNPIAHIVSGAVAGGTASVITNPLDVCKTLLNTQETANFGSVKTSRIKGLAQALRTIYSCCGMRGYFQGVQARVVAAAPSTAIAWSVYELFKFLLIQRSNHSNNSTLSSNPVKCDTSISPVIKDVV